MFYRQYGALQYGLICVRKVIRLFFPWTPTPACVTAFNAQRRAAPGRSPCNIVLPYLKGGEMEGYFVPFTRSGASPPNPRFQWWLIHRLNGQKSSARPLLLIFPDYAHGSADFGSRIAVSRYCSHRNHFPSPFILSFMGLGLSAPPQGINSFIYPCSSSEV